MNTRNTKLSEKIVPMNGTKYVAKCDMPFGIKKGDIFAIVVEGNRVLEARNIVTNVPITIDPTMEPKFFELVKEPKFKIGTMVMNTVAGKTFKQASNTSGLTTYRSGTFVLPCYVPFKVVGFVDNGRVPSIVVEWTQNTKHKLYIMAEKDATLVETYYFINSSGVVCVAYYGKDKAADTYRSSINNMFSTLYEANMHALTVIKR